VLCQALNGLGAAGQGLHSEANKGNLQHTAHTVVSQSAPINPRCTILSSQHERTPVYMTTIAVRWYQTWHQVV
jgi:hypothetical protein